MQLVAIMKIYIKQTNTYLLVAKNTIKVYNTNDLSFKQDIAYQIKTGFAQTKDGTLWGANGNKLIKINVETLDYEEVELPNGLSVFYNQWYPILLQDYVHL